jgi:hypothetical protein
MLPEAHDKSTAWTQIWYLTDKDKTTGNFKHRKGLTLGERQELVDVFRDFLEHERAIVVTEAGKVPGPPDSSPSEPEDDGVVVAPPTTTPLLDIHDPKHYSFGEKLLWIPWGKNMTSGPKRGSYAKGYPTGMVLHWTAGHRNGLVNGNQLMRDTGMLYLVGDKDGNLGQSDSLQYHGYHAGKSSHKYANGYVSDEWVGLELQAAGNLTKSGNQYLPWFKVPVPESEVIYATKNENIGAGYYHMYTPQQMLMTRKLVCWLYLNNPTVFSIDRVCGHDEVSPGRKSDPGGALVDKTLTPSILPMSAFRKLCWEDVGKIQEAKKKL